MKELNTNIIGFKWGLGCLCLLTALLSCTKTPIAKKPQAYVAIVHLYNGNIYEQHFKTQDSVNSIKTGRSFVVTYDSLTAGTTRWKMKNIAANSFKPDTLLWMPEKSYTTIIVDSNGNYNVLRDDAFIKSSTGYAKIRCIVANSYETGLQVNAQIIGEQLIWPFNNRFFNDIKLQPSLTLFTTVPSGNYQLQARLATSNLGSTFNHTGVTPTVISSGRLYSWVLTVKRWGTNTPSIFSYMLVHQ
ncbi:MAG: hypothetical protein ACOVQE_01775 [Chitinophagaceae bacterium]